MAEKSGSFTGRRSIKLRELAAKSLRRSKLHATMDYIKEFDIKLEKEMYYAGETLAGHVVLDTVENFKVRAVRVVLRGKAHAEWKVVVSGDRRTVKDDQYFIDDRVTIWGKEKAEGNVPILPRGLHTFAFKFQLPESSLPCSFESKAGTIRYYIKVTIDIPYASPPQGMKYFTIIGPHIDCMDEQYLKPLFGQDKRAICCLCCARGPLSLRTQLERSAYVCGESIKLKADIDNQSEEIVHIKVKLLQYVEYYIDHGVLGITKEVNHTVLEYRGEGVPPQTRSKFDSTNSLVVPVMPPTLVGVCRLVQIYYVLKVCMEMEKSGDDLNMNFPITIATCPFRIPNSSQQPQIQYDVSCDHVEGGLYIGPEFQLGQVYDGTLETGETIVLYRPVYVCVCNPKLKEMSQSRRGTSTPSTSRRSPKSSPCAIGGGCSTTEPPPPSSTSSKQMNGESPSLGKSESGGRGSDTDTGTASGGARPKTSGRNPSPDESATMECRSRSKSGTKTERKHSKVIET